MKKQQTISSLRGCTHAVRVVQDEPGRGKVAETYCGRKRTVQVKLGIPEAVILAGNVNCGSCIKAVDAEARR